MIEGIDSANDVEVNFTHHALQRLRERFGMALDELRKLLHNSFDFESFSVSGRTHWRMIIPLRFSLIGAFEKNSFVVKTVFFNIGRNLKKQLGKIKRLRISDIHCPMTDWQKDSEIREEKSQSISRAI